MHCPTPVDLILGSSPPDDLCPLLPAPLKDNTKYEIPIWLRRPLAARLHQETAAGVQPPPAE
jgi:hypothetical protein